MSWNVKKVGKGADVAIAFAKEAEAQTVHLFSPSKEVLLSHVKTVTETATAYPEAIIVAHSFGHLDCGNATYKGGGNAELKLEVLYPSQQA